MSEDPNEISRILKRVAEGDREAKERLVGLIYDDFRRMARNMMLSQRPDHTLQATDVVHLTWIKIFEGDGTVIRDSEHLFAVATMTMRRILIDHARGKGRAKRNAGGKRVPLDDRVAAYEQLVGDPIAFEEALEKLRKLDERAARVAELRIFLELPHKEIAAVLGIPLRTVESIWKLARARLRGALE